MDNDNVVLGYGSIDWGTFRGSSITIIDEYKASDDANYYFRVQLDEVNAKNFLKEIHIKTTGGSTVFNLAVNDPSVEYSTEGIPRGMAPDRYGTPRLTEWAFPSGTSSLFTSGLTYHVHLEYDS